MQARARRKRIQLIRVQLAQRWRVLVLASLALLALGSASVFVAFADNPVTFYACLNNGGILTKVSIAGAPTCSPSEALVSWNQVGPTGPPGPTGPAGPSGPPGP